MQCSKKLNLADIFHLRKYPDKKIIDFIVSIESEYIQLVALMINLVLILIKMVN